MKIIDRTASFLKKIFTSSFKKRTPRKSFDLNSSDYFEVKTNEKVKPRPSFAINLMLSPPLEIIMEPIEDKESLESPLNPI